MILTKIDAIRFAEDFNLLSQFDKSIWLDRAYIQLTPNRFQGLTEAQKKAKMEGERSLVAAWKKQVGRVTTARNRLRALFIKVSWLYNCQFSPRTRLSKK